MSKAIYDCYLSDETKNSGEMSKIVFKGNKLTPFKLDDCIWLVYSKKRNTSEGVVKRLSKAIRKLKKK